MLITFLLSWSQILDIRRTMEDEMLAIHEDYEGLHESVETYQNAMWQAMQAVPAGMA